MAEQSEVRHDLFIVHAEADRAWVDGYLRPEVGVEPDRLITRRDFQPGAVIADEYERAVASSRYTALVLSPAYLADRWAEFGEQLVSFTSVEEGRGRVVALTLEPCQPPARLRFLVGLDFTDSTQWKEEAARLRDLLDRPEPAPEVIPSCPYPGMVPFRPEDERFFFGREAEIQILLTKLRAHRFLLVIGTSGSGKSSLVLAGLLPKLADPNQFRPGTWKVITLRPGAAPCAELAARLAGDPDPPDPVVATPLATSPPAQRRLLYVDQFEEVFSLVKDRAEQDRFLGRLKALSADKRWVVLGTMRADFYGDLIESALKVDDSQQVTITAPRGEALRRAIVAPAEKVGVYLEDSLVERLLADAADEPGTLPMLQETLVLLWDRRQRRLITRRSYDDLGQDGQSGMAVAMANHADGTLADLPPEQQLIACRIFLRLVQFGEGRPDTRRQLPVQELRSQADDPQAFDHVLSTLIDHRLLTPSLDERRGRRVDIAHEMLIIGWPELQKWVKARRDAEQTRRRLEAKAKEWVRFGRANGGLLDSVELLDAERWLTCSDAAELGIDADIQALATASREAINRDAREKERDAREKEEARERELKAAQDLANERELTIRAQRKAMENAAEILIESASTALLQGNSFGAMHLFAGAIETLPDSSLDQVTMRQCLGFLVREVPRVNAIVEHADRVRSAAFSPDGGRIVTASEDRTARVWRADTGALIAELKGHAEPVWSAAFSPEGSRIVTASEDRTARVWMADTGALIAELKGHAGPVRSAAFSPEGSRIVTASRDCTARVWRADTGALIAELKGHAEPVWFRRVQPGGQPHRHRV